MKVFVLGSINTDLVISAKRLPKKGETVKGESFFVARGGKGANQAAACAKLGGDVVMCGCVGNDDFGLQAIRTLDEFGVDTAFIHQIPSVSSGTAVIMVENGDNRIILDGGANECLTKNMIDDFLQRATSDDIFLTQLENPVETIGYALRQASEKGMYVVLNPAPANVEIIPYLQYCNLITPNQTETELLGGMDFLLQKTDVVLQTLGSEGYAICTKEHSEHFPCPKVRVVDTTAAGDTLCGGLCAYLSRGGSLQQAAHFGSVAASLACIKKGAQPAIPTLQEVLDMMSK